MWQSLVSAYLTGLIKAAGRVLGTQKKAPKPELLLLALLQSLLDQFIRRSDFMNKIHQQVGGKNKNCFIWR